MGSKFKWISQVDVANYKHKFQKEYDKCKVEVRLGELEQVMKAAKRCLQFNIQSDTLLGGSLTVEGKEMADAFKSISEYLESIKAKTINKVEKKIGKRPGPR